MAWRMVFISIGILVAGALAPAFVDLRGGDRGAYLDMAIMLGVVCSVSLVIAWLGARAAEAKVGMTARSAEPQLTLALLAEALREKRFAILAPVTLLQLTGVGMAYAALLYFLTYNMGSANAYNEIGIVVLLASAAIIVGQPIWLRISAQIGRGRTYIAASLLHAAANIGWGFSTELGMTAMYIFAFLLGIGSSGWALMGHTILIDIASGGRTGVYTSSWMAIDKIGFALGGTLLLGVVLSFWHFDAERAAQGLSQPPSALTGILVGFAIFPALVNVVGAAIFAIFGRDI